MLAYDMHFNNNLSTHFVTVIKPDAVCYEFSKSPNIFDYIRYSIIW